MLFFGNSLLNRRSSLALISAFLTVLPVASPFAQELPEFDKLAPLAAPLKVPIVPPLKPTCTGAGVILMDAVSGQVLYEKDADKPRPMASTTKIMTALLLVENLPETEIITASKIAANTKESSVHLKAGEKLTAKDLLRAILLRSANDGCVAAAERISGSEAKFADRMNQRARELGATHTHFVNPHGLHNIAHYTTPRDLALIARAAMLQSRIAEVVCLQKCVIARSSSSKDVSLRNHSHFLGKYFGADGIKTGWTIPAGKCYVGSVTRNGWRLISVTLKSKDYVADTKSLMDYGFGRFAPVTLLEANTVAGVCPVTNGTASEVVAVTQGRVQAIQKVGENSPIEKRVTLDPVSAPLNVGATIGRVEVFSGTKLLSTVPLISRDAVAQVSPTLLGRTTTKSGLWGRLGLLSIIFGGCLVSFRYVKRNSKRTRSRIGTSPKGSGNRRNRLAESVRNLDR